MIGSILLLAQAAMSTPSAMIQAIEAQQATRRQCGETSGSRQMTGTANGTQSDIGSQLVIDDWHFD